MPTVTNEIDKALQASVTRYPPRDDRDMLLACTSPGGFKVSAGGVPSPASIVFSPILIGMSGTVSYVLTGGLTLTYSGNEGTLAFANMAANTGTVEAVVTVDGITYRRAITISKVFDGAGGGTTYTHDKYADDEFGAGMSDSPVGKKYIGLLFNQLSPVKVTDPAAYPWALFRGEGIKGDTGASSYIWLKFADDQAGSGMSDDPTGKAYMGIATNKTTQVESTDPTAYAWTRIKGEQGIPGTGSAGARGAGWFYVAGGSWSDLAAELATPGGSVVDDQVTIWNGTTFAEVRRWTGSEWVQVGPHFPGDVVIPGTLTGNRIRAGTLELFKPDGTAIITLNGLQPGFEAPDTKNSEQTLTALGYAALSIVGRNGSVSVVGNTLTKVGGTNGAYDADAYSKNGFTGGAFAGAIAVSTTGRLMFGLNTDPLWDASFSSIDFALYLEDGNVFVFESGVQKGGALGTYVAGDAFAVWHDRASIFYEKNGALLRSAPAPVTGALYFDSSFYTMGASLKGVQFGPLTSIANSLNKNAADILQGPIALQANGALVAGDIAFDVNGNRTSGTGSAMNKKGFVHYGPDGAAAVVINAAGVAVKGDISGSTGTFGAVVIGSTMTVAAGGLFSIGKTAYGAGGGNGLWFGFHSGVPKFRVGDDNQYIDWDGVKLTQKLDTFSVTISGTLAAIVGNGAINYGNLTASITGDTTGGVTYSWAVISYYGEVNTVQYYVSVGGETATATITGAATNNQIHAQVELTVRRNSDGRIASAIRNHNPIHGTYNP